MTPTPEQLKVYEFIRLDSNHGIIDAVAGSGKTTTIIESIGFTDNHKSLIFCAFNKSIRDEINSRVAKFQNKNITVKNLHQLGFDILRSNNKIEYHVLESKYNSLIRDSLSTYNRDNILRYFELHDLNIQPSTEYEKSILKKHQSIFTTKLIDCIKKYRLTLTKENFEDFKNMVVHYNIVESVIEEKILFAECEILFNSTIETIKLGNALAKDRFIIDLDDMLYLPKALDLYPNKTYDILFIDECQDLSNSQLAVALKYVKKNGRVIAVGDPCQSIYGFTGADIKSFQNFERILKNHIKLQLSYCFRCPDNVIEYAQNFRSDIKPFSSRNGHIEKIPFEKILEFLKPKDLVISRTKAPLTSLFFILLENNIKVKVHQDDIKDLINELRFLFSKEELNSNNIFEKDFDFFEKVRNRNIYFAEKKAEKIHNRAERIEFVNNETEYIDRRISFLERQISIQTNVTTINSLILKIENLISDSEDAIKLSTIHRAKGLEDIRVFILDYDKLPLKKDNQKDWELIQENNLKYVALTRAKESLYLVDSIKEEIPKDEGNLFDDVQDLF